jgi:hypothetical protein
VTLLAFVWLGNGGFIVLKLSHRDFIFHVQKSEQAQKRPKVFGCAQIISLRNSAKYRTKPLDRLPIALSMRNDGRANVTDPTR